MLNSINNIPQLSKDLKSKITTLQQELKRLQPGVIAISGGVDSRFIANLSTLWNLDHVAIHFSAPYFSPFETDYAQKFLASIKMPLYVLAKNPLIIPEIAKNTPTRCYYCKKFFFTETSKFAQTLRRSHVLEGSNANDISEFRPGIKALKELGINSPLIKAGFKKIDIRSCSNIFQFPYPNQPSRPCLLTRFAYGYIPSTEELSRVAQVEKILQDLGLQEFRLRILKHGHCLLQIEANEKQLWEKHYVHIQDTLTQYGFTPFETCFDYKISGFYDQNT